MPPLTDSALTTALREALAHLDDPPHLERLELSSRLRRGEQDASLSQGQALRRALRLAIASLDPGVEAIGSPLKARSYQVLYRYAIARESMVAIGMSLGISARQAYRELNAAIEGLCNVLTPMLGEPAPQDETASSDDQDPEFAWLADEPLQDIDLPSLLAQVIEPLRELAGQYAVRIDDSAISPGLQVHAKRLVLRQSAMNLLSHAIRTTRDGVVIVSLRRNGPDVCLAVSYSAAASDLHPAENSPYAMALRMLAFSAIRCDQRTLDDQLIELRLLISGSRRARILIVDDNQGLVNLYSRYLAGQPYDVEGATDLDTAVLKTQEITPDLIVLDIMMPGHDGWEVLQAIRSTKEGRRAKVIVCSVIDDPELASALGAAGFMNKPLTQAELVQTLSATLSSCK